MNKRIEITRKLKDAKGKILLEKTQLDYSKELIEILTQAPDKVPLILKSMEITEQELFDYLTGNKKGNIALYDQILTLTKKEIMLNQIKDKAFILKLYLFCLIPHQ